MRLRWKDYYQALMNFENQRTERVFEASEETEVEELSMTEVAEAISRMKGGQSNRIR